MLDEATSSVDPETDATIQKAIKSEFKDVTLYVQDCGRFPISHVPVFAPVTDFASRIDWLLSSFMTESLSWTKVLLPSSILHSTCTTSRTPSFGVCVKLPASIELRSLAFARRIWIVRRNLDTAMTLRGDKVRPGSVGIMYL
jgi:hypothetical protein